MFGLFTRKSSPQLKKQQHFGYMGKTPLRPDFVKLNVCTRESIAFEHWLQEGYASLTRQHQYDESQASEVTSLFYVSGSQDESSLLGVLQPSEDSSTRRYPFASYVNCPNAEYKHTPAFLFFNKFNVLSTILNINERVIEASSIEQMQQYCNEFSTLTGTLSEDIEYNEAIDSLRTIQISELWQAIGFDQVQQRAQFISQLIGLLHSIANRGCLRSQFGLKLPMPAFGKRSQLVGAVWLHLISTMVADRNWQPWWFYQLETQDTPASLVLFLRPVSASYFDAVWMSKTKSNSVLDLTEIKTEQITDGGCLALAEMDNLSIYDALRRWSKL
ncbi:hypothetical protein PCIT_a2555 [Pseudoalteromonas citrea]|uniref:Type VI secretion system-associated protein TagF n=2 Tax=Pseudoalteromonas citrea TaxID=43655 RepID=A0AAD4FRD3_9GAMM|nr:type VI secretion system-associated protein TagF [Pseudoalteromonas citrea]KAF7769676.1 hypothetical protein PCIT_a2555 [Pseudoalteromonas citrea]